MVGVPLSALGAAIRAARLDRGLTQDALAKRAKKHPTYLSGIESGDRNPTHKTLAEIAAALDMRLSELVLAAERQAEAGQDGSGAE
jgi:transcriptional regulator with XRE-family HTH domain